MADINYLIAAGPQTPVDVSGNYQAGRRNALMDRSLQQKMGMESQLFAQGQEDRQRTISQQDRQVLQQEVMGAAAGVIMAPPEKRAEAYKAGKQYLDQRYPGAFQLPEEYDEGTFLGSVAPLFPQEVMAKIVQDRFRPQHLNSPASTQAFNDMTKGLSPEDVERARRINLGLNPRAASGGFGFRSVMGSDGREYLVRTNPQTGEIEVAGSPSLGGGPAPQGQGPRQPALVSPSIEDQAAAKARGTLTGKGDIPESDKKNNAKRGVTSALNEAAGLYDRLNEMGGIVDVESDPVSNVVAKARSSGVGQAIGGAVGTEAQSLRNQINQLRPTLMSYIRQATEMGARGLDSEKELEFYLQAVSDPRRDIQSNKAALKVLDDAYGLGSIEGASEDAVRTLKEEFARRSGGQPEAPQSGGIKFLGFEDQ